MDLLLPQLRNLSLFVSEQFLQLLPLHLQIHITTLQKLNLVLKLQTNLLLTLSLSLPLLYLLHHLVSAWSFLHLLLRSQNGLLL